MFYFQGYLSCNRFGVFLGLAHAAMTAEGDNSVLMQVTVCIQYTRRYTMFNSTVS